MRAGALRHKVEFIRYENVVDEFGQTQKIATPFCKAWASIVSVRAPNSIKGTEAVESGKLFETNHFNITCRYVPVTQDVDIFFGGELYEIVSLNNVEMRNKELKILAKVKK